MWLRALCLLEFNASVATPLLLMLRPRSGGQQWV
ncbi:MAG: transglutaminase family protein, partial [Planctomycetota bacterium]